MLSCIIIWKMCVSWGRQFFAFSFSLRVRSFSRALRWDERKSYFQIGGAARDCNDATRRGALHSTNFTYIQHCAAGSEFMLAHLLYNYDRIFTICILLKTTYVYWWLSMYTKLYYYTTLLYIHNSVILTNIHIFYLVKFDFF